MTAPEPVIAREVAHVARREARIHPKPPRRMRLIFGEQTLGLYVGGEHALLVIGELPVGEAMDV